MTGWLRRRALLLAAAAVAGAIAACSTDSPSAAPSAGTTIGPPVTASAAPLASFGPPPSPTPDDASPVVLDADLLALLPTSIGETPVQEDLDAAAQVLSDPALDQIATGVDAAVAVDLGNGNLVYAVVVKVKPAAFGEEIYRQWRDSYDEGACTASGGVVGHAEADIGGRKTYVTSCAQGLHTYHVWIEELDALISASSIGDGRFGEALLQGLRVGT